MHHTCRLSSQMIHQDAIIAKDTDMQTNMHIQHTCLTPMSHTHISHTCLTHVSRTCLTHMSHTHVSHPCLTHRYRHVNQDAYPTNKHECMCQCMKHANNQENECFLSKRATPDTSSSFLSFILSFFSLYFSLFFFLSFFLSFFLRGRRPNLITGLSGWWGPD